MARGRGGTAQSSSPAPKACVLVRPTGQTHVQECRQLLTPSLHCPLLSLSGAPWRVATACSNQQIRQTCVRKSLICAFAIAFIISVMLIAANQVLRSGMK